MTKIHKRYFLLFVLALIPFHSSINGCGWWYEEDEMYYNLFNQLLLKEEGLRPFLLTATPGFFDTETNLSDENIDAWISFIGSDEQLHNLSYQTISALIYRTPLEKLDAKNYLPDSTCALMANSKIGKQIIKYLQYAKTLEPYALENTKTWETVRVDPPSKEKYKILIEEGMQLWKACNYDELRLRYGYQLVRLAHYSGNNEEALELFDKYVTPVRKEHIIYYYALEQKGGVLYNLGRNAEANYLFCQVFDHSDCRKKVAYNSIRIQDNVDWNQTYDLCKTDREKAVLYAMRGYNTFSNETEEMRNILQICPDSPYIKLLALRYMNKMERFILDKFYNTEKDDRPFISDSFSKEEYENNKELINSIINHPKTSEKDFWAIYLAHMAFLCKDYNLCKIMLAQAKTSHPDLLKQASRTRFCLYLTTLKSLGKEEEKYIRNYMAQENIDEDFVREIVAHLYKQQGENGKAYLIHNSIGSLEISPDLTIINSLIEGIERNGVVSGCASTNLAGKEDLTALYELKGTYYLRMGDFAKSLQSYSKIPEDYACFTQKYDYETNENIVLSPRDYNGYSNISPLIFSNGFKRWFNIPAEQEMTDTVYLRKEFSFLNKYHNKKTLAQSLLQLSEMAQKEDVTGAYAAYLLANYYFNISAKGYYRNIPFYFTDNSASYKHFGKSVWKDEIPDLRKVYNYKDFYAVVLLTNDAFKALHIYNRLAESAPSPELRARALFMAAACLRDLNDNTSPQDEVAAKQTARDMDSYYSELVEKYANTRFFKEAKNECKYLDYYIKDEL